MFMLIYNI